MVGYSGTPLDRKLGLKPGHHLVLVDAPDGFEDLLDLPPGVLVEGGAAAAAGGGDDAGAADVDVIVWFNRAAQALEAGFGAWAARLVPDGGLWIAWPKRASGVPTDLDENGIRAIGLAAGLVDNKVCAIDETWSGLRFVYRRVDRPKG